MIKKITWVVSLVIFLSGIWAIEIDFIPNPGSPDIQLRTHADVYYHDESDDQHWYGADRWAVYFDVPSYFSGTDSITIVPHEVVFYCPTDMDNNSVTFTLCANGDNNQPDESNVYGQTVLDGNLYGWQTVPIPDSASELVDFWIVMDYETNNYPSNPELSSYVSASSGGGVNSYYWDPDYGSNGWFQNMDAMGFASEFLIGVNGTMHFPVVYRDLEVNSIGIQGVSAPLSTITPCWTLTNHSAVAIEDISLHYTIVAPDSFPDPQPDVTMDPFTIAAGETIDAMGIGYRIRDQRSQFRYTVTVSYPVDSLDVNSSNNTKTMLFDTFTTPGNNVLIENFLQGSNSVANTIWDVETETVPQDSVYILNYFPDISDSMLYTPEALTRYNHYEMLGYPSAIVHGRNKITGFSGNDNFADSLSSYYSEASEQTTFFLPTRWSVSTWESGDYICYAQFNNQDAYVFSTYLQNLKFYAALVEEGISWNDTTIPGYTFIEFFPTAEGVVGAASIDMTYGETASYNFAFNINNIDAIQDTTASFEKLSVLCFFQFESTLWNKKNRMEYAMLVPLSSLIDQAVGVHDETAAFVPNVQIYPNPFRAGQSVQIRMSGSKSRSINQITVDVYNIRGQKVRRIVREGEELTKDLFWDGRNQRGSIVSSGVYLMRIQTRSNQATEVIHKNCLLIK